MPQTKPLAQLSAALLSAALALTPIPAAAHGLPNFAGLVKSEGAPIVSVRASAERRAGGGANPRRPSPFPVSVSASEPRSGPEPSGDFAGVRLHHRRRGPHSHKRACGGRRGRCLCHFEGRAGV